MSAIRALALTRCCRRGYDAIALLVFLRFSQGRTPTNQFVRTALLGALSWSLMTSSARAANDCEAAGSRETATSPSTEGGDPTSTTTTAVPQAHTPAAAKLDGAATASDAPASAAAALGRRPARVKCLDESLIDEFGRARARKGVQVRTFRKKLRLAIGLGGGVHAGDALDTQWQVIGNLAFWIGEDFGFDAEFRLTPMTLRIERSATEFSGRNRYPDGITPNLAYTALGHLMWSPFHTKLRAGEERIIHGDFVLYAGAGPTFHDVARGIGFDLGVSLYLYPSSWLSVRLDLGDHILPLEVYGSRRISNNLVFSTSLALWIPFRRS